MKRYTKGFTLIELLVVIAIIGILASVVLVSLNTARNKGKDTRVINNIQQIRTALESEYNGIEYTSLDANATSSSVSTNITQLSQDIYAQGSTLVIRTNGAAASSYVLAGRLVSDPTKFFCIASDGTTNPATTSPTGVGSC